MGTPTRAPKRVAIEGAAILVGCACALAVPSAAAGRAQGAPSPQRELTLRRLSTLGFSISELRHRIGGYPVADVFTMFDAPPWSDMVRGSENDIDSGFGFPKLLSDGWGRRFTYRAVGTTRVEHVTIRLAGQTWDLGVAVGPGFEIRSPGPDGARRTADDVVLDAANLETILETHEILPWSRSWAEDRMERLRGVVTVIGTYQIDNGPGARPASLAEVDGYLGFDASDGGRVRYEQVGESSFRITDAWRDGKLGTGDDVAIEGDRISRFSAAEIGNLLHGERRPARYVLMALESQFPGPLNTFRESASPSDQLALRDALAAGCHLPPPETLVPFLESTDPRIRARAAKMLRENVQACWKQSQSGGERWSVFRDQFAALAVPLLLIARQGTEEASRDASLALALLRPVRVLEDLDSIALPPRLEAELLVVAADPTKIPSAEAMLADPDWRVRIAAHRALSAMGAGEDALVALEDPDPAIRADTIARLDDGGGTPAATEAATPVALGLAARTSAQRFVALKWLTTRGKADVDLLKIAAEDDDRQTMGIALAALEKIKDVRRVQELARGWLASPQPLHRSFALRVLPLDVVGGDAAGRKALADAGNAPQRANLLVAAVRAGTIGRAAVDGILASASVADRQILYGALLDSSLAEDPTFVIAGARSYPTKAMEAMTRVAHPSCFETLARIGRGRPLVDRSDALVALGNLWDGRAEDLVLESFRHDVAAVRDGKEPRLNGATLDAMGRVGSDRSIAAILPVLDWFLDERDPENAWDLLRTLRSMGTPAPVRSRLAGILPELATRDTAWDRVKNEVFGTLKAYGVVDPRPVVQALRATRDQTWRSNFIELVGSCPAAEATAALEEELERTTIAAEQRVLLRLLDGRGADDAVSRFALRAPGTCMECLTYLSRPPHRSLPVVAALSPWWKRDGGVILALGEIHDAAALRLLFSLVDEAPYETTFPIHRFPHDATGDMHKMYREQIQGIAWPSWHRAVARCHAAWRDDLPALIDEATPGGLVQLAGTIPFLPDEQAQTELAKAILASSCPLGRLATLQAVAEAGVPPGACGALERIARTDPAPRLRRLASQLAGVPELPDPPAPALPPDAGHPLLVDPAALRHAFEDQHADIVTLVRIVRFGQPTPAVVERLGNTMDPRAVPPLLDLLGRLIGAKQWTLVPAICRALALIGDGSSARPLAALAVSSAVDPERSAAVAWIAEALANIDDPRVDDVLVELFGTLPDGGPRESIRWALRTRPGDGPAEAALRHATDAESMNDQRHAWRSAGSGSEALVLLREVLQERPGEQRAVVTALLADDRLDLLEQLAPSLAPDPTWADWSLFERHPTPALLPFIEPWLARFDNDGLGGPTAFTAIAKIRDPRSAEACARLLADAVYAERNLGWLLGGPSVAPHARVHAALAELFPVSRPAVEKLATSAKPGERLQAALVLEQLRQGEGLDLIRLLLADPYPYVRFAVLRGVEAGDVAALRREIGAVRRSDLAPRIRRLAAERLDARHNSEAKR